MAAEWPTKIVGDLAGSISETHSFANEQLIFLNTSDILQGNVLHRDYSAVKKFPGQAKKSIRKGDILFSEIRPANGRYAYIDFEAADYVVSTKLMVIRAGSQILPKYLYHFLTSKQITDWLQHLAESRSGTFPQITFDQVATLELNLPSKVVQAAIIEFVDALNDKIERNRKMNQTLEAMARAIFKSWFVDFDPVHAKAENRDPGLPTDLALLFPDSFENSELGEIPKGWKVIRVADIGKITCGKTPSTKVAEYYGKDIPFITIPDMHGNVFATTTQKFLSYKGVESQKNKTLPAGTICVSCIATPGLVVITTEESQTNQQINSIIPVAENETYFWFWTFRNSGDAIRAGGSGGSVLANMSTGRFAELLV